MDQSQHSIQNHDHHSMHSEDTLHAALEASSTTMSPMMEALNSGESVASTHDHHAMDSMANSATSTLHHMITSFHFGCSETILFSWWQIDNVLGLIGSMIAIFVMALLYEGLKYYREYLFWRTYNLLEYRPVTGPQQNAEGAQHRAASSTTATPVQYVGEVIHKQPPSMLSLNHLYQTLLHVLQVTLSFLLMLIFMTFNVWLCIAVVLGAAVGYFLFCWKKSVIVDVTEHCH